MMRPCAASATTSTLINTRSLAHTRMMSTTKNTHCKSAWINKRWSCASQANLWGEDSSPHQPGSSGVWGRESEGEGGHRWLPGKQFVCLLSWCFVSGYSSLQSAHLGYVPLNGIYKTWDVFSQLPPPLLSPHMTAQHASLTLLQFIHYSGGFAFLLKQ